jgi:hypothetical protein
MSKKLCDEIIENIDNDKYHLYFEGDKESFLLDLEYMFDSNELTYKEYNHILNYVESISEDTLDDMVTCNPDLED